MSDQDEKRKEMEARLVARARADAEFKQLLLTHPREAIAQETGVRIPEVVEITVLEETSTRGYLVLPVNANELSDEQLEAIAGGQCACNHACH